IGEERAEPVGDAPERRGPGGGEVDHVVVGEEAGAVIAPGDQREASGVPLHDVRVIETRRLEPAEDGDIDGDCGAEEPLAEFHIPMVAEPSSVTVPACVFAVSLISADFSSTETTSPLTVTTSPGKVTALKRVEMRCTRNFESSWPKNAIDNIPCAIT